MADVTVTFSYTPDDPDPSDPTGVSEEEHSRLLAKLMELGAVDIKVEAGA